ncbi:hypothetical protein [Asaia platycodi]|uniref:hypothetical protein n=1 Tax=Asaia platycodi TaxID=610243 RepID=UPI0011DE13EF|nr:hypothetical protein [Asaia platycodi]
MARCRPVWCRGDHPLTVSDARGLSRKVMILSRNIYFQKADPDAQKGVGSFPLSDAREALKAIGDPSFKEWGVE